MSLSLQEQEIHINAARDEALATAYCSDRTWITKFDKLVDKSPALFQVIAENENGKTYQFPKRLISIRSSITVREISDEQKEQMVERLRIAREVRLNN